MSVEASSTDNSSAGAVNKKKPLEEAAAAAMKKKQASLKKLNKLIQDEQKKIKTKGEGSKEHKAAVSDKAAGVLFDGVFSPHHTKEKENFINDLKQPVVPEEIFDDFYNASDAVRDALFEVLKEDPLLVQLVKSTPGIGKTEAMLAVLFYYANRGVTPFYAASTREQVWQIYDRLKAKPAGQLQKIINLQGRHGGYIRKIHLQDGTIGEKKVPCTCYCIEAIRRAQEKGYHPQYAVCAHCPFWPKHKSENGVVTGIANACGYFKGYYQAAQVNRKDDENNNQTKPIVLMTHAMAACVVTDSEMIRPEVFCFDEDFTSALREAISWDEDELQRVVDGYELVQLRRLMRQSVRVAKRFRALSKLPRYHEERKSLSESETAVLNAVTDASFGKDTVTLSGIDLYLVMRTAAYEMGRNLEKVLESAASFDKGVPRGAFKTMTDEQFARLPHASEPDLAQDLLTIIADAKQAKETAYRISLRKTRGSEWGFFRDRVRQINYGERLIILDAYGEEKIYERVCNREVKTTEIKCQMRDNVTVFHHPERTTRRMMDDLAYRLKLYYSRVVPVLEKSKNKKVLIYTQKCYGEWLKNMIERSEFGLEQLAIKWFWMDHGDDNYGDYDKLIIFGSAYSNVVGDMHLVNAIYEGDEVVDFSKLKNEDYADDRVAVVKKSRQENEMMQAIFRLRPSKPREAPQEIHIISAMKLPLTYEMPGATKKMNYFPSFDREGISKGLSRLYDRLGFYVAGLAPFIYETELLIDWYEAGGTSSDKSLLMTYDEYKARFELFVKNRFYRTNMQLFGKFKGVTPKEITFHKKTMTVWGDEDKAIAFLEELRREFYEPGCYDDDPKESPEAEPVDAQDQDATDTEQVSEESKKGDGHQTPDNSDVFEFLNDETMSSDEDSPVYGKYKKTAAGDTS